MPIAYEGGMPYIFVSYSHRDTKTVMKIVDFLQLSGYRVWFDGGIEAGSEWPEYIADHLERCACLLSFISDSFVDSQNCRRELNFALELKKPVLNVYIEDVELTAGMRMQLGLSQAIFRKNYADDNTFCDALSCAKILGDCRDAQPKEVNVQQQEEKQNDSPCEQIIIEKKRDDSGAEPDVKNSPVETRHSDTAKPHVGDSPDETNYDRKLGKTICTVSVLLELSYAFVGPKAMEWILCHFSSGWERFLFMCIPHLLITLIIRFLVMVNTKKICYDQKGDIFAYNLFAWVISSVLAVIFGAFLVPMEMNGVLKALLSLGLNVAPALLAIIMHFSILFSSKKSQVKRKSSKV